MIPAEAVEAAARAFYGTALDDVSPEDMEYALEGAKLALEAAASYIRAQALEDAYAQMLKDQPVLAATWLHTRAAAERGGE